MDLDEFEQTVFGGTWPERVAAIRAVPTEFPGKEHQSVYAAAARVYYQDQIAPHFHMIPWDEKHADRASFRTAYDQAAAHTAGFTRVRPDDLAECIERFPMTVRIFRLMVGYTPEELAKTTSALEGVKLGKATLEGFEAGRAVTTRSVQAAEALGHQLAALIAGTGGFEVSDEIRAKGFRTKLDKPDTQRNWDSVRDFHEHGVPYSELLYQRFYGGSFRQIQDAGGSKKGNLLEDAVEELLIHAEVPHVRTTSVDTIREAREDYGVTVQPAPDFVIHDGSVAKGLLECKSAGDGGTARDKAARFRSLRTEAQRLGGIPVLAVLDGLGWRRLNDALGPVVRDCDGRVFTGSTLDDLLLVDPVAGLRGGR